MAEGDAPKKKKKEKEPWPDHPVKGKAGMYYLQYPTFCMTIDGETVITGGGKGGEEYGCVNVLEAHKYTASAGTFLTVARLELQKRLPTSVRSAGGGVFACAMNPPAAMEIFRLEEKDGKHELVMCLSKSTETEEKDKELNVVDLDAAVEHAATGGFEGVVRIWRIGGLRTAGGPLASLKHTSADGKRLEVKEVRWNPSAAEVVTLAADKTARIWSVEDKTVLSTLQVSNPTPTAREPLLDLRVALWFSPQEEGAPLLMLGASGMRGPAVVSVWDVKAKGGPRNARQVTVSKKDGMTKIALNEDHSEVALAFANGVKARVSTQTWTQQASQLVHDLPPSALAYCGDVAVSVGPDFVAHFQPRRRGSRLSCYLPLFCVLAMIFFLVRLSLTLSEGAETPSAESSYGKGRSFSTLAGEHAEL